MQEIQLKMFPDDRKPGADVSDFAIRALEHVTNLGGRVAAVGATITIRVEGIPVERREEVQFLGQKFGSQWHQLLTATRH